MSFDKIAESLGVRPLEEALKEEQENSGNELFIEYFPPEDSNNIEVVEGELVPDNQLAHELTNEIEEIQSNIKTIINKGMNALDDLVELSKSSESARGYEVAGQIMEKLLNANKELLNVAERKRMSKEESGIIEKQEQNITQNNLIVTTNDVLQNLLEKKKSGKK